MFTTLEPVNSSSIRAVGYDGYTLFFAKRRQSLTAEILGGGDYGEKWADWLIRVQYALSMPDWWRTDNRGLDAEPKIKPNQA